MNKDALITDTDVDQLNADIKSKAMSNGVSNFMEGEPHLAHVTGVRLGMLHDALDRAGVCGEERRVINQEVNVLLGLHVYLLQRATRRILADFMPDDGSDGAP